ncbi:MAG: hypothetical protein ACPGLY_26355, partial [Rubripirellula sp.]
KLRRLNCSQIILRLSPICPVKSFCGCPQFVLRLLEADADVTLPNESGETLGESLKYIPPKKKAAAAQKLLEDKFGQEILMVVILEGKLITIRERFIP